MLEGVYSHFVTSIDIDEPNIRPIVWTVIAGDICPSEINNRTIVSIGSIISKRKWG
jgi:hypothetical protein